MMRKINFALLFSVLSLGLFVMATGCKKKPDPQPTTTLALEGEWQLESINFTDASLVTWDPAIDFTTANRFGFAPYMWSYIGMKGFSFEEKKVKDDLGSRFVFLYDGNNGEDMSLDYWYWNYLNDKKGFEIEQINPQFPPFNYSIMDISEIKQENDGNRLTFKANMYSRKVGEAMKDIIKVPVEIKIMKAAATAFVNVLIEGESFVAPDEPQPTDTSARAQLLNTHWKLKVGSDVYDPGMVDQDSTLEYMKIVALSLQANDTLLYRYSFPMGIVPPKKFKQDALDQNVLKTQMGDGNRSPIQVIEWEIESIDKSGAKELKLKEKKTGTIRTFVLIDDIETGVEKDDYNIIEE